MKSTKRQHAIERGVSFYSFQEEYFLGKMWLEDCVAIAAELDIPGIEIIGEQMVPGFPDPGENFFSKWHQWMQKYGRTPVCHDMFLDWNMYKGRLMTEEEMVQSVVRDIKFANRLGCTVIRVIGNTPPEVVAAAAPYAEQYNVRLGLEIHAPISFEHERVQRHIEMMDRVRSPYLGFIPDMGIFVERFPRVVAERFIREGAHEKVAGYIVEWYNSHEPVGGLLAEVDKMGGNVKDQDLARAAQHYIYTDPAQLFEQMPRIFHVHAKFYEMLPNCTEYSIPYSRVVQVLIEGGYSGYLSSEYEGNRHIQDAYEVDSVEQVRRHQTMLLHLLGEAQDASCATPVPRKLRDGAR